MRRVAELSSDDLTQVVLRNPQTSAQWFGIEPRPDNGGGA